MTSQTMINYCFLENENDAKTTSACTYMRNKM